MPYANEHAARVRDIGLFQRDSFRSKQLGTGVRVIMGRLKGQSTMTIQTYRFSVDSFTSDEARAWLKKHNVKYIRFEKATGKEK